MIPDCLNLTTQQEEKFEKFLEFLRKDIVRKYQNDDVSIASPITFEIYATGMGDNIIAKGFGYFCILTIDDDGEIINDDTWYQSLEKKSIKAYTKEESDEEFLRNNPDLEK